MVVPPLIHFLRFYYIGTSRYFKKFCKVKAVWEGGVIVPLFIVYINSIPYMVKYMAVIWQVPDSIPELINGG